MNPIDLSAGGVHSLGSGSDDTPACSSMKQVLHDTRNHMWNLSGLGLLLAKSSHHPDAHMFMRCVQNETQQVVHLLEVLCAFTQGADHDEALTTFDASEHLMVVGHGLLPLAQEAGILLRITVPQSPFSVTSKPRTLNRLLGNLIRNAIGHSRATRVDVGIEVATETPSTPRWRYSVCDDGIGIGMTRRQACSTDIDDVIGRGHGLSICRSLASQLAGDLRIEDGQAGGTNAYVSMPLWQPEALRRPG